jgi:hypothetical protein
MAYSKASLSAAEVANFEADLPLILGANEVRDATTIWWNRNGSFTDGNGNEADSDGPTSRLGTDEDYRQTYPDATRATWYLMFDLGSAADAVIDSVVILNHNIATLTGTIEFQLADDQTFATSLITCEQETPSTDKRVTMFHLDELLALTHARFSSVRYARLRFTSLAGGVPTIGEVIMGRRRQLGHNPTLPYNDRSGRAVVEDWYADSGASCRYVRRKGQRTGSFTLRESDDTYIDDLVAFFRDDIDYGTKPWVWVENPTASQHDANWMRFRGPNPDLNFPLVGFSERTWELDAEEVGPNYLLLEE